MNLFKQTHPILGVTIRKTRGLHESCINSCALKWQLYLMI